MQVYLLTFLKWKQIQVIKMMSCNSRRGINKADNWRNGIKPPNNDFFNESLLWFLFQLANWGKNCLLFRLLKLRKIRGENWGNKLVYTSDEFIISLNFLLLKIDLTFYILFSGEEREVRQILLHKDLEQFKPEKSLPEFLLRKYVKAVKSSLSNPCSALVPYQPPEKLLSEILNKNEKTTTAGHSASSVNEAGVRRSRSSSMETDE